MWAPSKITEWLDERIDFIQKILLLTKEITSENKKQISDCTLALENFKYCKKLHFDFLQDSTNNDIKKRFRNIANKLIFDTIYELDKQEYKCVSIHECCFPSQEKEILPQEIIDNITKIRAALENIFHQVQQLCDGTEFEKSSNIRQTSKNKDSEYRIELEE